MVGVDAAGQGWLAICLVDGALREARAFARFEEILNHFAQAQVIAVDIPIGLPVLKQNKPWRPRKSDQEARAKLGTRFRCVFVTAPRELLEGKTLDAALRLARNYGVPLTAQSYALRHRILEVDRWAHDARIVEVHPEISFWAMNGQRPVLWSKKTWAGLRSRLRLLQSQGLDLLQANFDVQAAAHDVVDAAACAWSAWRYAHGQAGSLPSPPEATTGDRVLAIWY